MGTGRPVIGQVKTQCMTGPALAAHKLLPQRFRGKAMRHHTAAGQHAMHTAPSQVPQACTNLFNMQRRPLTLDDVAHSGNGGGGADQEHDDTRDLQQA